MSKWGEKHGEFRTLAALLNHLQLQHGISLDLKGKTKSNFAKVNEIHDLHHEVVVGTHALEQEESWQSNGV